MAVSVLAGLRPGVRPEATVFNFSRQHGDEAGGGTIDTEGF
jgi:hypothetical protein